MCQCMLQAGVWFQHVHVHFAVTRLLSTVKTYFFILLSIFLNCVEMKKKISFVHGESQTKQVNYVGFMAEAGMPCTDGEFDSLLW